MPGTLHGIGAIGAFDYLQDFFFVASLGVVVDKEGLVISFPFDFPDVAFAGIAHGDNSRPDAIDG